MTRLAPGGDHSRQLAALVRFYRAAQRAPLPHFPGTAEAYAGTKRKENEGEEAFEKRQRRAAEKAWLPDERSGGESEDAAIAALFGTASPFSDDFFDITETIWEPLIAGRSTR